MRGRASARRTDPATSHDAARGTEQTKAPSIREKILAKVREMPLHTAGEYERMLGLEKYVANWRLNDLHHMGLVHHGPARLCEYRRTMCVTWLPGHQPEELKQGDLF